MPATPRSSRPPRRDGSRHRRPSSRAPRRPRRPAGRRSPPGWVQASQRAGAPLVLDLLADPGVGLVGPGAEGTARGLAVALLADAGAHRAELLATAETAELLGRGDTAGVDVAADLADALGRLEVETVHRSRLFDAHDTDHLAALAVSHPEEPLGPLILLAPAPPPGGGQRLQAVLTLGRRLGIGAILLGSWPTGLTLTVDTDATVGDGAGGRAAELVGAQLGPLTDTEAAELLGVLAAARPGPQPAAVGSGKAAPEAPAEQWIEPPPRPERAGVAGPVELRLLGPVRILAGGDEIDTGLRSKARELLAYLATRPQGVSDEAAVEALWPDAPPGRGMEQFHTAVGNLRKVLRTLSGLGEAMFVEHTARRYRTDPALVEVDLWSFHTYQATVGLLPPDSADGYVPLHAGAVSIGVQHHTKLPPQHHFSPARLAGPRGVGVEIVIEVDDVDAAYTAASKEAKGRGGRVEPLGERPWGLRDFRLVDPDGHHLRVTSHRR